MAQTRSIRGVVEWPAELNPPPAGCGAVVELRDVSLADAPSQVVAERRWKSVQLSAGGQLEFELDAPASPPQAMLSLRAQIDVPASQSRLSRTYLSTQSVPVPAQGPANGLVVGVTRIAG